VPKPNRLAYLRQKPGPTDIVVHPDRL